MPEFGRTPKVIRDSRRFYRGKSSEPKPSADLTEVELSEWNRIIKLLRARRVLDALDQASLQDYLICWSRLRECEAAIGRDGVLVPGDRGLVKNPAIQLARNYRDAVVTWSREFGLTVKSRTQLAIPAEKSKKNKFAELGANSE